MSSSEIVTKCFITAFRNKTIDTQLADKGFSLTVISFAIPDLGIQYRCRVKGNLLELELKLFFSLLDFIKRQLKEEKISNIMVLSSNPQFVFAFTPGSDLFKPGSANRQALDNLSHQLDIQIGYVPPRQNQALVPAIEYPSVPKGKNVKLKLSDADQFKSEYKPFQQSLDF